MILIFLRSFNWWKKILIEIKFLENINKEEINLVDKDNINDIEEVFLEDNNLYDNVKIKNEIELKIIQTKYY